MISAQDRFFNGVVNEVTLFNIALSDAGIRTLMEGLAVSMTVVKLFGNLAVTCGKIKL